MNTYIKTQDSTKLAAVRATRAQVLAASPAAEFVPATAKLLAMAKRGSIPTLAIHEGGLSYI